MAEMRASIDQACNMFRTGFLIVALLAGALGLTAWAILAQTGPVGWLNGLQQSIFGAYSIKITVLVLTMIAFGIWSAGVGFYRNVVRPRLEADRGARLDALFADTARAMKDANHLRVRPMQFVIAWVIAVPLIWGGFYAWFGWQQHERGIDIDAQYQGVDLLDGDDAGAAGHDHLAVRGRYLFDAVLSYHEGHHEGASWSLVPVVPRHWQKGQPVAWIAKVDDLQAFNDERRSDRDPYTFLAVPDGAVPTAAIPEFDRLGAPLAESAVLLRVVPSHDGRPVLDRNDDSDLQTVVVGGSVTTITFGLILFFMALAQAANLRRAKAPSESLRNS